MYDTIIIGSGISGLYYAYLNRKKKILVLESNNRVGGRVCQEIFHGVNVVYGAGVGRAKKDKLLLKLLDELKVKHSFYESKINYILPKRINILNVIRDLKKKYSDEIRHKLTFNQFLLKNLSQEKYENFIMNSGYTDYLDADIHDTIYHYGFDDNVSGNKMISISWKDLLEKIVEKINPRRILLKKEVISLDSNNSIFKNIFCSDGSVYHAKEIILAIPPSVIYKLLGMKIYKQIKSQTFCRFYIYIKSVEFSNNITSMTFTYPPIQKIIKMSNNVSDNVYMISYSDNKSADYIKSVSNHQLEKIIFEITGYKIRILDKLIYYFKTGTHYFSPLPQKWKNRKQFIDYSQNPMKNVFTIGEAFSFNQGWCEGALESVENISKLKYKSKKKKL